MADNNIQGLLQELGVQSTAELEAKILQQKVGGGGRRDVAGLFAGIKGLFTGSSSKDEGGFGKGGRGFREFFRDYKQATKLADDRFVAEGMGLPGGADELRRKRATQQAISSAKFQNTGNAFEDQMASLKQITQIAQTNGDVGLLFKTQKKIMELRQEKLAFDRLESKERRTRIEFNRDLTTGVDIIPQGVNALADGFRPSSAVYVETGGDDEQGAWLVTHPDGTSGWQDQIQVYDPLVDPFGKTGTRVSESLQKVAISQAGGGKSYAARRDGLLNLTQIAEATGGVTDLFLSFQDPQAITAFFGSGAVLADKVVRFGESMHGAFTGKGVGDGTYIDNFSGRSFKDDTFVWNGRPVSESKQKALFMESARKVDISIPEHLRATLAEVANGAAQYRALIMEMAYMDARQQEPSNRGLSDNDIKAALERIGGYAANPVTFLDRQVSVAQRNLRKMENLGAELSPYVVKGPSGEEVLWDKVQIKDNIYDPGLVTKTIDDIENSIAKMTAAKDTIIQRQLGTESPDVSDETDEDFLSGF
jgi:hypothetical protein